MQMVHLIRAREVVEAVRDVGPEERDAALVAACAGDDELLALARGILSGYTLDGPEQCDPVPGSQIGPYTLLSRLGEGGFGVVYLAEQHEPLRRQVALKVIKPGM